MENNELPAMEINDSPAAFQHVIANNRTARDFTEACAICLIPLAPSFRNTSLVLCENCEQNRSEQKQPVQGSDAAEIPLSSADISLTLSSLSDEDTENPAFGQLDREANLNKLFLRVKEELRRDESENINHSLLNAEDSRPKGRIIEIVKRVLKACGYAVGAVIGIPLIAGAGVVFIVAITVAGALSPPVLLAIARHRKYTSNRWWTYTRKQRYYAVGWGAVLGTLMLPFLAPWGIYKLFKFLGAKLLHKTIYWIRLLESHRDGFLEEHNDENSSDCQMESVSAHQAEAHFVLDRGETNMDRYQFNENQDLDQLQPGPSQPLAFLSPEAVSYNDGLQGNCYVDENTENDGLQDDCYVDKNTGDNDCYVDENAEDVKRVRGILAYSIEEEDEEDVEVSCHKCRLLMQKTNTGRETLSDEESDCGRRDTQRLWARKVVSDTLISVKIPNKEFKERELVSGLDETLCARHQRFKETDKIFSDMKNNLNSVSDLQTEALKILQEWEKVPDSVHSKLFPQNIDEGTKRSSSPQCEGMKDLPEKGPKKSKRRRKRRNGKKLVAETQDSSPASEANETPQKKKLHQATLLKQSQLQQTKKSTEAEKEKEKKLPASKTTPHKTCKAGQPAQELEKTGEKGKNIKRKVKTPKGKLSTEKIPETEKNKTEEGQTVSRGARRKLACRFDLDSPKKNQPEAEDFPEQKSHKLQSKMACKAAKAEVETKLQEKPKHATRFNLGINSIDNTGKQRQRGTVLSPASSERDLLALYDKID